MGGKNLWDSKILKVVARSPRGILKSNTTDNLRFTTERFPASGVKISLAVEAMVEKKFLKVTGSK